LLSCNQEEIWFHGHFCTAPLTGWVILSSCFLLLLAGYNVHQCTVSYKGISLLYFCRSREIVSFGGVMFRSLKTEPAFFPFCDSDLLGAASDPEKDTDTWGNAKKPSGWCHLSSTQSLSALARDKRV
jgi:hypothetical protein